MQKVFCVCIFFTLLYVANCFPLSNISPKFDCSNLVRMDNIDGDDFSHLAVTLTVPRLANTELAEKTGRLEAIVDVPFKFISGSEVWIKHFEKEGRAILRYDSNSQIRKSEAAAALDSDLIQLRIMWNLIGTSDFAMDPKIIKFAWNDGPTCKYLLTYHEEKVQLETTSTSTTIFRKKRNVGNVNASQRRQSDQERRWNLNYGRSYFLTTIEE